MQAQRCPLLHEPHAQCTQQEQSEVFDMLRIKVYGGGGRATGVDPPSVLVWVKTLHVLLGTVRRHCEVSIPGGQKIKHARVEINVLHLQLLPTALLRPVHTENLGGTVGR